MRLFTKKLNTNRRLRAITMLLIGVIIISTILMGGCNSDSTISKKETPYGVMTADAKTDANGEYINESYLTDKHPEVIKVKEVVEGYIKAFTTADYKTHDGMGTYEFVSSRLLQKFKDEDDINETLKFLKGNKIVRQYDSININTIQLMPDMKQAIIKGTYRMRYNEGTEAFLKKEKLEKGILYERNFIIRAIRDNDVWKIDARRVEGYKPIK